MSAGIYKITSPSGKIYIGQSIDIEKRWNHYRRMHCKRQPCLYNSFLKYGYDNHIFEMIFTINQPNLDVLTKLESAYIKHYDCISPNGLNLESGGDNKRHSAESKLKMSIQKINAGMAD